MYNSQNHKQVRHTGQSLSILGDIQTLTGHSPNQPVLADRALSRVQTISRGPCQPQLASDSVNHRSILIPEGPTVLSLETLYSLAECILNSIFQSKDKIAHMDRPTCVSATLFTFHIYLCVYFPAMRKDQRQTM